jgi:hypothetical protein
MGQPAYDELARQCAARLAAGGRRGAGLPAPHPADPA